MPPGCVVQSKATLKTDCQKYIGKTKTVKVFIVKDIIMWLVDLHYFSCGVKKINGHFFFWGGGGGGGGGICVCVCVNAELFWCLHNPPNSDMDNMIFTMHTMQPFSAFYIYNIYAHRGPQFIDSATELL